MSDRVILAVKFTPAGTAAGVRRAVGGFLRYVQHRDLHPTDASRRPRPEVSGLAKYIAYRDRASARAELFGPGGTVDSEGRKQFAGFVAAALEGSRPQLFRGRDGRFRDRRRAVYRMVISPERAEGLDLRRLTQTAIDRLESDSGVSGLHWIAAVHRNTAHHHVHLVVAGMLDDSSGGFTRLDLKKSRLAAMKETLSQEIARQRSSEQRAPQLLRPKILVAPITHRSAAAALIARAQRARQNGMQHAAVPRSSGAVLRLRVVARRYQRQMQHELEQSYRLSHLELVA